MKAPVPKHKIFLKPGKSLSAWMTEKKMVMTVFFLNIVQLIIIIDCKTSIVSIHQRRSRGTLLCSRFLVHITRKGL